VSKVYQGTVDLPVAVATGITLTGATATQIRVKKPSGALATWAATIDGSNAQQLNYTTTTGDLNEAGRYFFQSYAAFGAQVLFGETIAVDIFGVFE
jgi:hypothetical protein